jgi:starch-binding outer membrane protein, SusD/RagB family
MRIKQLFIGLGLSCAIVFSSCEKVIEVEPEFQRDDIDLSTLQHHEWILTGAYAQFQNVAYFGSGGQTTGTWSTLPDMMSDNLARTGEDLGNWFSQANWIYTSDEDDIAQAWLAAYSIVTQANLILSNIDQFAAENPGQVNRIKGQALAIRGMVHFDLLRYWGESYVRNSNALGVPYKETVDPEELPMRLSVRETYDKIYRDLLEAETLLGDVDRVINRTGRAFIDELAVKAILARVNLYAEEWNAAEDYATQVIVLRPLASREEFPGIWTDANKSEVIWSVTYNAGEGTPSGGVYNAPSNRNRFRPAQDLVATYNQNADIRYSSYFGTRMLGTSERQILSKFVSRGAAQDNLVDWKVFRTGEMYLIRAEARARKGGADLVGALLDLNTLRAARIAGYVPAVIVGQQAILDAIELERRKELIGEGHRWFDLKRTTRTIERVDCDPEADLCSLAPSAREWAWPIPQVEIDANPSISDQQTTGY